MLGVLSCLGKPLPPTVTPGCCSAWLLERAAFPLPPLPPPYLPPPFPDIALGLISALGRACFERAQPRLVVVAV
eukprot:12308210-Prorocentrum_lima.AAC.1